MIKANEFRVQPRYFAQVAPSSTNENITSPPQIPTERGLYRLLNQEERKIMQEQQELSASVRRISSRVSGQSISAEDSDLSPLDQSAFCIVLAGEFNAGKSTVLNALLGEKLLDTGSLPTTDRITLLSHTNTADEENTSKSPTVTTYHHDLPLLEDLTLVDTPGTNAVWKDHTATTMRLLPKADLILFCTSADRPFPESERQLLESLTEHRKAVVVVITKMDVLEASGGDHGATEKQRVIDFVTQHAGDLLGSVRPVVLPISARNALGAKLMSNDYRQSSLWERSNFDQLEHFLRESLTTTTKIKSKLSNPIGLCEGSLQTTLNNIKSQQSELDTDVATLRMIESQMEAWRTQLESELNHARARVETYLNQYGNRSHILLRRLSFVEWFAGSLQPQKSKLTRTWAATLPPSQKDSPMDHLEQVMIETAETFATQGRAQGQAMIEFLGHHGGSNSRGNKSLVASVTAASRFEETRSWLDENLRKTVNKHLDSAGSLKQQERDLLVAWQHVAYSILGLQTAFVGIGVGLFGGAVEALTAVPLMGGLTIGQAVLATSGRERVASQFSSEWGARSEHVLEEMTIIGQQELERVQHRIQEGVSPYTRYVQAEQDRLAGLERQCQEASLGAQQLRNRINKL